MASVERPPSPLASRLKQLRDTRFPGKRPTQKELAKLFDLGESTVSSYETNQASPTDDKLRLYARFFATPRSVADDRLRLLAEGELRHDERVERDRLFKELQGLRSQTATRVTQGRRQTWHFTDGNPVRIVCGEIPADSRSKLTEVDQLNYTKMLSFADLDAAVDLFGHIRAENPRIDAKIIRSGHIESDDLSNHIVLLGGSGWNKEAYPFAHLLPLPVAQVDDPNYDEGEVFEVTSDAATTARKHTPQLRKNPTDGLLEDVGMFARVPNPYSQSRTLTICSGVYSRGVVGSVRLFTDPKMREQNEQYLAERFGETIQYCILFRVRIHNNNTVTPDLTIAANRLFEWPDQE